MLITKVLQIFCQIYQIIWCFSNKICNRKILINFLAIAAGRVDGKKHYPLEICRREIACYKQIYKIAKDKNVQLISLFKLLGRAFGAATLGYQLYQGG